MSIIDDINSHEQQVLSGVQPEGLNCCPACNTSPCSFNLHERRKRIFYIIEGRFVQRKKTCLGRWKCVFCKVTFTYYPDYAIPYKRYVKEDVILYCKKYLLNEDDTYNSVSTLNGLTIVHEDSNDKNVINDSTFAGTTIWRWLKYYGSLKGLLKKGLDLIRQKDVSSMVFRKVCIISKRKYRSNERKTVLERCLKLFEVEEEYKKIFKISLLFFPGLVIKYP